MASFGPRKPLNARAMFARLTSPALAALLVAACGESPTDEAPARQAAAAVDKAVEAGRAEFGPCAVCHSVREGDNARVGPSLYGVYGREAGTLDGFAFSKAMTESGIAWNDETLDAFIENPQGFLRGNRMAFVGEKDAETRTAIIGYLKTLQPAEQE